MSSCRRTIVKRPTRRPRWTLEEDTKLVELATRYSTNGKPQWRALYDLPEAHAAFAQHISPEETKDNTKHLYKRLLKIAAPTVPRHSLCEQAQALLGKVPPKEPTIPELLAELRRLATESAEVLRRLQQTT